MATILKVQELHFWLLALQIPSYFTHYNQMWLVLFITRGKGQIMQKSDLKWPEYGHLIGQDIFSHNSETTRPMFMKIETADSLGLP